MLSLWKANLSNCLYTNITLFTNFIAEDVFQYWVMPTNYPEVTTRKVQYYFLTQTLL